jgi:di/tricarboxylate transporter
MPLAFATILGGMVTLIGTPPNIIIAAFRERALGDSFNMFDFAPVGLTCAVFGVAFVAFVGWRMIPVAETKASPTADLRDLHGYVAELAVVEESLAIGQRVADLDDAAEEAGVAILGLFRGGDRLPGGARRAVIRQGDILVVDAPVKAIDDFVDILGAA